MSSEQEDSQDSFYDVVDSPARTFASPPAKHYDSVTFSTRFKYAKDPSGDPSTTSLLELPDSLNEDASESNSEQDETYEVLPSPSVRRYDSPPAKGTSSITYSARFVKDPNYETAAIIDLPETTEAASRRLLDVTANTMPSTDNSSPESVNTENTKTSSPDPVAAHINRIARPDKGTNTGQAGRFLDENDAYEEIEAIEEDDSYYDVYESPRATVYESPKADSLEQSYLHSMASSYNATDLVMEELPSVATGQSFLTLKPRSSSSSSSGTSNFQSSESMLHSAESGNTLMHSYSNSNSNGTTTMNTRIQSSSSGSRSRHLESSQRSGAMASIIESQHSTTLASQMESQRSATMASHMESQRPSPNVASKSSSSGSPTMQSNRSYFMELYDPDDGNSKSLHEHKKSFAERNQIYRKMNQQRQPMETPLDPDGQLTSDNNSTHGESLVPTPDSDNEWTSFEQNSKESSLHSSRNNNTVRNWSNITPSSRSTPSGLSSQRSGKVENSKFPSIPCLVCLAVLIFLALGGLTAGVTYYLWVKVPLDPLPPPAQLPINAPASSPTITILPEASLVIPTDEDLLALFSTVVGQDVSSEKTAAGKAANWMLYDDPSKRLTARSEDAWIQRYLLAYAYFATTVNGTTKWLSCNPPFQDNGNNVNENENNACQFANPTELPGGKVIYDLVPSYRWLSGEDECQWGGVACGKTITTQDGSRLAVTSIVLANQYLKGSIVTDLTALPELKMLDLSHNGLQGTLSDRFRTLETLRLQYNAIEGNIPSNFFDDESAMKELNIGANGMTGTIPSNVGLASQMTDLYLFENDFTGTIPVLGQMPLVHFQGQRNRFSGMLPFDYSYEGKWPETLTSWWAFDNLLSGELSGNLGFLSSLEDLRLQNNELKGSIPDSIRDLQRLFRLEVQSNGLTGTVPEEIGNLPFLKDVRMQYNAITGVVPTSLCFLDSMEVLQADCLGPTETNMYGSIFIGEPTAECYCCTTCCNAESRECIIY